LAPADERNPPTNPLRDSRGFKLGVFSTNADGGLALTTVPERWRATWPDNVAAARIADEGGFDFFLPIARWAGFGGETRAREWSFETFAWAAGLAALTKRMAIFSTVHVPLVHPIYGAKALATVDHISGGRAGLNIVCGWNPKEFAMFGTQPDERAYDRAAEWITIVERAYAADEPFDFDGAYYKLKGVVSKPASVQWPRPLTMNAAFGDPGRDFASRHCDFLFSTFTDIADGRRHLADIRTRAAAAKREVGAYTVCHVVCRPTQAEAEDAYDRYALREADQGAVDNHMAGKKQFSQSHDERAYREYRQRFAGGAGSYPLVGTPEQIAATIAEIAAEGWSGAALSFLNYTDELPFFIARVFPLLREAGLR
jgi:alkanesulfonate monooxygenase SsuD/methylene tetrahydromethanopterin reductase-like flavin-dependent oxidoreductase (luciferase family)